MASFTLQLAAYFDQRLPLTDRTNATPLGTSITNDLGSLFSTCIVITHYESHEEVREHLRPRRRSESLWRSLPRLITHGVQTDVIATLHSLRKLALSSRRPNTITTCPGHIFPSESGLKRSSADADRTGTPPQTVPKVETKAGITVTITNTISV